MNHVKKEFAVENLLFVTILVQLQNYLISNGYWDEMKRISKVHLSYACFDTYPIKLPSNVPLSPIILQLHMLRFNNYKQNKSQQHVQHKKQCKQACKDTNICITTRNTIATTTIDTASVSLENTPDQDKTAGM